MNRCRYCAAAAAAVVVSLVRSKCECWGVGVMARCVVRKICLAVCLCSLVNVCVF